MRQEVLHKGSGPQSGTEVGLGEFQASETGDQTVSSGVHSASAHQAGQVCRCDARDGKTAEEAPADPGLGRLSRAAIVLPLLLIKIYQLTLSPYIGQCCRFTPSCSRYAAEAYKTWGFWRGTILTVYRLLRCQPFCRGGYDPVPQRKRVSRKK